MNDSKIDTNIRILFVTQRLSDFVEMKRAAVSLKKYGYKCIMLFCGVGSQVHDDIVIQEIESSIKSGDLDEKIIFNQAPIKNSSLIIQPAVKRPKSATDGPQTSEINSVTTQKWLKKLRIVRFGFRVKRFIIRVFLHLKNRVKNRIIRLIALWNGFFLSRYYKVPASYKNNYKQFQDIIKQSQINLIILPEDIVGNITPIIIKAGHSAKVPSLILPYTICNQSEAFQALKERNELSIHNGLLNKVLGILFRSWVMKDKKHAVLRLPAEFLIGHIITRSSPPDPWMMNSGYANVIAVENEQMYEYYKKSGIPSTKMKITGACYDDSLATYYLDKENQRAKLYKQLHIQSNKPLFLIGGFPNQIIGNPPGFDFKDAEDAVDFITQCIDGFRNDFEIIFRPHPNYLELADLFSKKNILVTEIDTAQLVAVSDVYLAFASATIRWAISCGVPTINYDMFYYDFSDYKHVKGVLNACTKDEFEAAVHRMLDPEEYMNLKNHLEVEKKQWGNLDGQSVNRINTLVKELVQVRKVRRKAS